MTGTRGTDGQVGTNVRTLRTQLGLTQAEVAARVNVSGCPGWVASTVAKVELGDRQLRLDELGCLAAALGVPYRRLLRYTWLEEAARSRTNWSADDGVAAAAHERRAAQVRDYDRRMARRLGVTPGILAETADELFGRPLIEERDARLYERLGGLEAEWSGTAPTTEAQSRALGHVTRDLLAELRADPAVADSANTTRKGKKS